MFTGDPIKCSLVKEAAAKVEYLQEEKEWVLHEKALEDWPPNRMNEKWTNETELKWTVLILYNMHIKKKIEE